MIHHNTSESDHWAIGSNDFYILLQVQEKGNQARIAVTLSEAKYIRRTLDDHIRKLELNVEQK